MDNIREKLVELIGSTEYGNGSLVGKNFQKGFIEKIASNLIARGVTVQEWIPVTERLPVTTCLNLAMTRHGITVIAYFDGNVWRYSETLSVVDATHWMPLPSAPKQEG